MNVYETFSHLRKDEKGLTLIEIMVVLFIIAAFFAIALPSLNDPGREIRSEIRKLKVLTRTLRSRARISNQTLRLVLEFPNEDAEDPQYRFWVEATTERVTLLSDDQKEDIERELKDDQDVDNLFGFSLDERFFKEPKVLPMNLQFDRIEYTKLEEPIVEGKAFIHFFPSGLVEESAIHIKSPDDQFKFTLAVHPLTGEAEIVYKDVELRDMVAQ